MDSVSFELWSDNLEFAEVVPFLQAEGLVVAEPIISHTRGLDAAQATTIIVAISGATVAIARAFQIYFKRSGKTFTASTLKGKIHAENFTADEIKQLITAADFLLLSKPEKKKLKSISDKG